MDTDDFLIGEDWMYDDGEKIDFVSGEMKWYSDDIKMVARFRGLGTHQQRAARTAKSRPGWFSRAVRLKPSSGGACDSGPDTTYCLWGQDYSTYSDLVGSTAKLPSREALDTWTPLEDGIKVLELSGELDRNRLSAWLDEIEPGARPLSNKEELAIGDMNADHKLLLLRVLRIYPSLLEPKRGSGSSYQRLIGATDPSGTEASFAVRERYQRCRGEAGVA
ncbi:hypothetical protein ON010_g6601 [Phytophthora cinnamomi]|nr:hypothetical protein ON010_g6601 [Phytophthora cinnamomi]